MSVTLDVQGKIFKTNYDTIIKIPYFRDMFQDCGQPTETVFIDRPSHIFKHILSLATDPFYQFPEKYVSELDFYCINIKEVKLYNKIPEVVNKLNELGIIEKVEKLYDLAIIEKVEELHDYKIIKKVKKLYDAEIIEKVKQLYDLTKISERECDNCFKKAIHDSKYCLYHYDNATDCVVPDCSSEQYESSRCEYHYKHNY
jgi:hypothetical protein